jgi:hypothetical protein
VLWEVVGLAVDALQDLAEAAVELDGAVQDGEFGD